MSRHAGHPEAPVAGIHGGYDHCISAILVKDPDGINIFDHTVRLLSGCAIVLTITS
jgi:hypothetical protein